MQRCPTGDTANLMMLGRELRLPDQLKGYSPPKELEHLHEYIRRIKERLEQVHEEIRQQQKKIHDEDHKESPLFAVGEMVLLQNKQRKRGSNLKLQAKFVEPYQIEESFSNHTYLEE